MNNICEFNGDIYSFNELNGYINFFIGAGLINSSDSITKLALLVHSDKAKRIPGIDIDCVSRSVNGYISYLRTLGDLDKSIRHFFELKQTEVVPTNGLDIIDNSLFSNPFKVASYIKFIVVNEINSMFNIDYYNPTSKVPVDNMFIKCSDFLKNYTDINQGIDQYYLYLVRTYTAYFEYYALYDYLLCYAYHLEEYGKTLVKNKQIKQVGRKTKKNKNRKTVSKRHKNKNTKKFGGVKEKPTLVTQRSLLAFAKRSPFWANIGTGTFTAAGVLLSGSACLLSAPFVYDVCTNMGDFITECPENGLSIGSIVGAGLLTGTVASISLLAGTELSSSSISTPYAKSGILFEREPPELKTISNIPTKLIKKEQEALIESLITEKPNYKQRISNLEKDLAKFNLYIIDDAFIGSNAVKKFRFIFKEYIVLKLKKVFDENVDEMVQLYRRKLLAEKISKSMTTLGNKEITLETIVNSLEENTNRLKFTEEELTLINTSVRSKVAGLIISHAEELVEKEVRKGKQGIDVYETLTAVDRLTLPRDSTVSILKQAENETKNNILTLVSSLVHIESANNFVFSPKVTANFINMNWIYICMWSLFSQIKEFKSSFNNYITVMVQIIVFFLLLVNILGDLGFDPINSQEIMQNTGHSVQETKQAEDIYASIRTPTTKESVTVLGTSAQSDIVQQANQFVQDYRKVEQDYQTALEAYSKSDKECKASYTGVCTSYWTNWMGLFIPYVKKSMYDVRVNPTVVSITTTPYYRYLKIGVLRLYGFGNFACSNWKTVGGLIGICVASNNILNTYDRFTSQVRGTVESMNQEITPYKFNLNNVLKDIQDDVDDQGGASVKTAMSQLTRTIVSITETNKEVREATIAELAKSSFGFKVLEYQKGLQLAAIESERLGIEKKQLEINQEKLNITRQKGAEIIQKNIQETVDTELSELESMLEKLQTPNPLSTKLNKVETADFDNLIKRFEQLSEPISLQKENNMDDMVDEITEQLDMLNFSPTKMLTNKNKRKNII